MRYRVWDIEDNKERILEDCVTKLEVGTTRKVIVKRENAYAGKEEHHFKVLEQLPEIK